MLFAVIELSAHTFRGKRSAHGERDWRCSTRGSWCAVADLDYILDSGDRVLCPLVLVAAVLAWFPCGHGAFRSMAMDCGPAIGAGFRSRPAVRVGLRTNRARNSRTDCSAEETGCGRFLPIRAEPDVPRLLRRMDRAVGSVRAGELVRDRGGGGCSARNSFVCAAV